MEEIKPGDPENFEFENRDESNLPPFLEQLDHHDANERIKMSNSPIEFRSTSVKRSIVTTLQELKLVVSEKFWCDYQRFQQVSEISDIQKYEAKNKKKSFGILFRYTMKVFE